MPYIKQNFQAMQDSEQPLCAEHLIKMEDGILEAYTGITRVESYINDKPMVNLRDLESGVYMLYGYFSPYQDSDSTIAVDNELVHVARFGAGSHIMSISPLNAKIGFVEILVDDAGYHGHTFTRQSFDMLEINGLLELKNITETVELDITSANVVESGLICGDPNWAGAFISSAGFVSTTALPLDFDKGKAVTVRCTIVGTCGLAFYDADNNPVLVVSSDNCSDYGISPGYAMQEFSVVPPDTAAYVRMSASTADDASNYEGPYSFLVRGTKTSTLWDKVNKNTADIGALSAAMGVKEERVAVTVSSADIIDGHFITGAAGYEGQAVETGSFVCTNYIHAPMKPGTQAEIRSVLYGNSGFAFYSKSLQPLLVVCGDNASSYGASNVETMQTVSVTVPEGTEYVRLSAYKDSYTGPGDFVVSGVMEMSLSTDVQKLNERMGATESRVCDARVLVIGDSISADYYGNYPKWVTHLSDIRFFDPTKVTNDSIHATGFVARYNGEANDFITRLEAVSNPEAYDLVIVFGGINDYIQNIPMGESGGDKTANFKPAVDYFFQRLVDKFAHARIAVLSPLRTYATNENTAGQQQTAYADYIKTVAKSYCLPVLNLTEESGFCPYVSSFMAKWTLIPDGYTDPDGVHPTEEYEKQHLAPMIRHFLQGLL